MGAIRNRMAKIILAISIMTSSVVAFTLPDPIMEHLHKQNATMLANTTSENNEMFEYFNEIQPENNSASLNDDEEGINRDWLVPQFLGTVLPSTSFFSSFQAENSGNQITPNNTFSSSFSILSRLFPNVIIDRPSLFRVQFYNSDLEDGSSPDDDDNSTGPNPNAVFGSPLCLGLCIPVQVFSENTSIHFLSDKQISLFPPAPTPQPTQPEPTPLYPALVIGAVVDGDGSSNTNVNRYDSQKISLSSTATTTEISEDGSFGWISSWIPTAPSLEKIQSSIQLPEFSKLSTGVSDLIG